jgi:hypothetical protein
MKKVFVAFAMLLVFVSCGGSSPIDPIPTPTPTPTPVPTATPEPPEIACTPVPPPIYGFRLKIHDDFGWKKILDSRPLIQDTAYCTSVGYPNYSQCVVRDENDPQAVTCANRVTGKATDTGRYGPKWTWNGMPCRAIGEGSDDAGCKNHPSNQFLVFAFGPGEYTACAENNMGCNTYTVP